MKYAAKKIVWMLLTMVIVSFLAFLAFRIIPGDPTAKLLGEQATPERVEALRQELGLSVTAFKYAVMAASGLENKEICRLFSVSEDSVKSSLKRTFAALGVKNRRGLIGKIPTIK